MCWALVLDQSLSEIEKFPRELILSAVGPRRSVGCVYIERYMSSVHGREERSWIVNWLSSALMESVTPRTQHMAISTISLQTVPVTLTAR